MASAAILYTREILALATGLAAYPWDEALPLKTEARSRSCGSLIALGLALDQAGRIEHVAVRSHACAVGQAAAAIFAAGAMGRSGIEVREAAGQVALWLSGEGPLPDWPGLAAIASARDYPGRHGAIGLAWKAASDLLP